jgi:hypothetical protein
LVTYDFTRNVKRTSGISGIEMVSPAEIVPGTCAE